MYQAANVTCIILSAASYINKLVICSDLAIRIFTDHCQGEGWVWTCVCIRAQWETEIEEVDRG